ncbi:MAG: SH3 domain-containing protein [Sphingomonas sp.]
MLPRKSFALNGPTTPLDQRTNAVRADLADIRLAEFVFAPHYAAALAMRFTRTAELLELPKGDACLLAACQPGDRFDALDFAAGYAWGIATSVGLVGYVLLDALEPDTCAP